MLGGRSCFFSFIGLFFTLNFSSSVKAEDIDYLAFSNCCAKDFFETVVVSKNWIELGQAIKHSKNNWNIAEWASRDPRISFQRFDAIWTGAEHMANLGVSKILMVCEGLFDRKVEDIFSPEGGRGENERLTVFLRWLVKAHDYGFAKTEIVGDPDDLNLYRDFFKKSLVDVLHRNDLRPKLAAELSRLAITDRRAFNDALPILRDGEAENLLASDEFISGVNLETAKRIGKGDLEMFFLFRRMKLPIDSGMMREAIIDLTVRKKLKGDFGLLNAIARKPDDYGFLTQNICDLYKACGVSIAP